MGDVYKDICDLPCCRETNYPAATKSGSDNKQVKKGMVRIKGPSDVPPGPHFVVIKYVNELVYDDWSETYTKEVAEHWATEDRKSWEDEIARLVNHTPMPKFVAFAVSGLAKVERKVSVNVEV